MFDFILIPSLSKGSYNALISVTYKFSKKVILIEGKDTFTDKKWAYTFFVMLDFID